MEDIEKEIGGLQQPESAHLAATGPISKFNPQNQNRDVEAALPPVPAGQSILGQNYGMSREDQPAHPPRQNNSYRTLRDPKSFPSLRSESQAHNGDGLPNSPNGAIGEIINENDQADAAAEELAWGPSHPCFPHPNAHVPLDSPDYEGTRIIRIRRDWMVRGDLAPTYSNLYPEILDPLLPEHEFRTMIHHINKTLVEAFDPYSLRNWLDGFLGLVTGWLWEDFGLTSVKGRLTGLEAWIEEWNRMNGARGGVKVIPLRRTGYMNLDIQIPDPQLKVVGEDERSRPGTVAEGGGKDAESTT